MADPTIDDVKSMQKRLGLLQDGNLAQTIIDLRDTVRFRPKKFQDELKMSKKLYEMFGVEPSENL